MAKAEQILFAVVALFCLFLFTAQSKNLREERQEHKLLFDSNSPKDKKVCRALVLEGGGDKGSWQAGVIKGLVEKLSPDEAKWDVVSGVSVGALNGLHVSLYPPGQESKMADDLVEMWNSLERKNVYTSALGYLSILPALIYAKSSSDNTPLRNLIEKHIDGRKLQRKFNIGVVDANKGKFISFNESIDEIKGRMVDIVVASTSMPFVFKPVYLDNTVYVDGGVVINLDLSSAITRCRQMVDDDSQIIVDAILPSGDQIKDVNSSDYTGYQMLKRYMRITHQVNVLSDLIHGMANFPDINFRYVIMPQKKLPSWYIPVNFDQKKMRTMIQMGKEDAYAAVEKTLKGQVRQNDKIAQYAQAKLDKQQSTNIA